MSSAPGGQTGAAWVGGGPWGSGAVGPGSVGRHGSVVGPGGTVADGAGFSGGGQRSSRRRISFGMLMVTCGRHAGSHGGWHGGWHGAAAGSIVWSHAIGAAPFASWQPDRAPVSRTKIIRFTA